MRIGWFWKTPNRDFVMNFFGSFATHFTPALRDIPSFFSRSFPATTTSIPSATSPSRMIFLTKIFGLPFSHAKVIAKNLFRMKITCWADYIVTTPLAFFNYLICRFTMLVAALVIAFERAVNSLKASKGFERMMTAWTYFLNSSYFVFESWHSLIIPHIEIEEKYCAIAVKRLQQEVFQF